MDVRPVTAWLSEAVSAVLLLLLPHEFETGGTAQPLQLPVPECQSVKSVRLAEWQSGQPPSRTQQLSSLVRQIRQT